MVALVIVFQRLLQSEESQASSSPLCSHLLSSTVILSPEEVGSSCFLKVLPHQMSAGHQLNQWAPVSRDTPLLTHSCC